MNHSECAEGYVCDTRSYRCQSGGCEAQTDVIHVEDTYAAADELLMAVVASDVGALQALVFAGGKAGFGFRRFYMPSFGPASDPVDDVLRGIRMDGPTAGGMYQPIVVRTNDTDGNLRFYWVMNTAERRAIRTASFNPNGPILSAPETMYSIGVGASVSQLAAAPVHGGAQLAWTEATGGEWYIWTQRVREDGTLTVAQMLGVGGRNATIASSNDRVDIFWTVPTSGSWSIRRRSTVPGDLFDLAVPEDIIQHSGGRPPLTLTAVPGAQGVLLFSEFPSDAGAAAFQLSYIVDDVFELRGANYLHDFRAVEAVRIFPHAGGGAWALVLGTWNVQRGLWLRHIDGDGSIARYPVRVLDSPLDEERIDQLSFSVIGDEAWVSWAQRDGVGAPRKVYVRGMLCELRP